MCASAEACQSLHALFTAATMGHVNRSVHKTPTGYVAYTTSADQVTVARLHSHVEAMRRRVLENDSIHTADPLFDAIFREGGVTLKVTNKTNGVVVEEVAHTDCAIALAHAHADAVSGFAAPGLGIHSKMHVQHPVPGACPFAKQQRSAPPPPQPRAG